MIDTKGQEVCTTDGRRGELADRSILEDGPRKGQQRDYVALCETERAKGFVRPYRDAYKHVGRRPTYPLLDLTDEQKEQFAACGYVKYEEYPESESPLAGRFWTEKDLNSGCGTVTTMGRPLAETYSRDPSFYSATFCARCGGHFPVGENGEFVWLEPDGSDGPKVGT